MNYDTVSKIINDVIDNATDLHIAEQVRYKIIDDAIQQIKNILPSIEEMKDIMKKELFEYDDCEVDEAAGKIRLLTLERL